MHDPDASGFGRGGRRLPLHTHVGEEVGARARLLGEYLVAATAVVPDRRTRQEDLGLVIHTGDRLRHERGALRAALEDLALLFGRPPLGGAALAGEMHD